VQCAVALCVSLRVSTAAADVLSWGRVPPHAAEGLSIQHAGISAARGGRLVRVVPGTDGRTGSGASRAAAVRTEGKGSGALGMGSAAA